MQIKQQKGFTLVEVLIALLIIAICFTAALTRLSQQSRDLLYLQNKTIAHWVAENLIAELALQRIKINSQTHTNSGIEKMANQDWRWGVVLRPTANKAIYQVDVEVGITSKNSLARETAYFHRDDTTP